MRCRARPTMHEPCKGGSHGRSETTRSLETRKLPRARAHHPARLHRRGDRRRPQRRHRDRADERGPARRHPEAGGTPHHGILGRHLHRDPGADPDDHRHRRQPLVGRLQRPRPGHPQAGGGADARGVLGDQTGREVVDLQAARGGGVPQRQDPRRRGRNRQPVSPPRGGLQVAGQAAPRGHRGHEGGRQVPRQLHLGAGQRAAADDLRGRLPQHHPLRAGPIS